MNLVVVSHLYPGRLSQTAGSFVHNQVRFLAQHCSLQVVAPVPWFPLPGCGRWSSYRDVPTTECRDDIDVLHPRYRLLPGRWWFSRAWRAYRRAISSAVPDRPDLVHAHCAYIDGLAAAEYARQQRCPLVLTVHGNDVKHLPDEHPRLRARVSQALQRADAVIAVSAQLAERVEELGADPGRVRVIPNGVDCEIFRPKGRRYPGESGWRLVYVGRFQAAKGIGVLLQALSRLRGAGRTVDLELIGGAPATGTAAGFAAEAGALGLQDHVRFVDEIPWTALPERLSQADIFVLPSFSEGLPLVLLEAMACGLPLVATRCGGPEEIVTDDVGVLVDVGDPDQLAAAIGAVIDGYGRFDPARIRRRAEECYDYRVIARRIHQTYQEVMARA